jgi:hypothetical protein
VQTVGRLRIADDGNGWNAMHDEMGNALWHGAAIGDDRNYRPLRRVKPS